MILYSSTTAVAMSPADHPKDIVDGYHKKFVTRGGIVTILGDVVSVSVRLALRLVVDDQTLHRSCNFGGIEL